MKNSIDTISPSQTSSYSRTQAPQCSQMAMEVYSANRATDWSTWHSHAIPTPNGSSQQSAHRRQEILPCWEQWLTIWSVEKYVSLFFTFWRFIFSFFNFLASPTTTTTVATTTTPSGSCQNCPNMQAIALTSSQLVVNGATNGQLLLSHSVDQSSKCRIVVIKCRGENVSCWKHTCKSG